ncbi:MAG: hypothetical protein COA79_22880 [Planctomycetota bacterium]|nr:MAG: hypothetical protein COA79_22880 [Planctomycetota bacterium]
MNLECKICNFRTEDSFIVCPSCGCAVKKFNWNFINIFNTIIFTCFLFFTFMVIVPIWNYSSPNFKKAALIKELKFVEGKDAMAEAQIYQELINFYPNNERYKQLLKEAENRIKAKNLGKKDSVRMAD